MHEWSEGLEEEVHETESGEVDGKLARTRRWLTQPNGGKILFRIVQRVTTSHR